MKKNRMLEQGAALVLSACCAVLLNSCGSGAVSSSSDPTITFALSPSTPTTYSGVPFTLTISGGGARGPYLITSSNATLLPIPASSLSDTQITLTPGTVTAQQSVTISVTDQAGKTATSVVTIQPNLINSNITVTGNAPPGFPECVGVGFVCAGQSGTASLTVSQNGVPVRGKSVRFDVIQGDFRFPVDVSQTLFSTSVTVTSDESGRAMTVLRADSGALPQIATIRATDNTTGAFRTATFFIKQSTVGGGQFVTVPPQWTVTGSYAGSCPSGSVDFLIFGGTPPYDIRSSAPAIASIFPTRTAVENPSRFTATFPPPFSAPTCGVVTFTITDATGLSIQSSLTVAEGTGVRPTPVLNLSPDTVDLACGQSAQVTVSITDPGTPPPTVTASIGTGTSTATALTATVSTFGSASTITLTRGTGKVGGGALATDPVTATVSVGAGSAIPKPISVKTITTCP